MESQNRSYVAELDQLRGAAALLVFFYHSIHRGLITTGNSSWPIASNPLSAFVIEGHTGVALFIVLSAFLLARGTFGHDIIYKEFLRNRALRIFPLMFVVIVLSAAATPNITLGGIAAWFALMGNTSAAAHDKAELIGTLWTAAVEFQFYLIAPFLFAFTDRKGIVRFLLPLAIFFLFIRLVLIAPSISDPAESYRVSYFTIAGRINQFLIGIGLAYLLDRRLLRQGPISSLAALIVSVLAILALMFFLNHQGGVTAWHRWHIVYPELEALLWAVFLFGYIGVKPLGRSGAILKWFGDISFGMYVLHFAIQRDWWVHVYPLTGMNVQSSWAIIGISMLVLIPVVLISYISYRCVELPFHQMRRRYLARDDARSSQERVSTEQRRIQQPLAYSEEV